MRQDNCNNQPQASVVTSCLKVAKDTKDWAMHWKQSFQRAEA